MRRFIQYLPLLSFVAFMLCMLEMGCAQRPKNRNHKRIQNLKSDTVDVKGELPPLSPQDFDELDRRILKAGKKGGPKGFKKFGIDCKKFNKKYQGQLFGNPCYDKKKIKGIFGPKKGFFDKKGYGYGNVYGNGYGNSYGSGYGGGYGSEYGNGGPNMYNSYSRPGFITAGVLTPLLIVAAISALIAYKFCDCFKGSKTAETPENPQAPETTEKVEIAPTEKTENPQIR